MKIYGLTIISSDGDLRTERNGKTEFTESFTKLSADKESLIDYAKGEMRKFFDAYDFEFGEHGELEDMNGNSVANFEVTLDTCEDKDICIQGPSDSHITFEFFEQDLGDNIINRDDYLAVKVWDEDDIRSELTESGFEGTDEQVSAVINDSKGELRRLSAPTGDDWDIIDTAIEDALGARSNLVVVSDIQWDVDSEEMSSAEYSEILKQLPEEISMPVEDYDKINEKYSDGVADYLSDIFGYCVAGFTLSFPTKDLPDMRVGEIRHVEICGQNLQSYISTETSAGVLKACVSNDPNQPGISVTLEPAGYEGEIDVAYATVYENPEYATDDNERPVDVAIFTYGDATTDDCTNKEIIRREDVIAGLGTGGMA